MQKKRKKKNNAGFTLVETLIGISILMISVAAPLSLAAKGIEAANLAKQQIIAYYLAQDVYEFIKAKTDSNKLDNASYGDGGIIAGMAGGGSHPDCTSSDCRVDTLSGTIEIYNPTDRVGYNASNNVYGFDYSGLTYENSIYSRKFRIEKKKETTGISIDEIKVTVTVG